MLRARGSEELANRANLDRPIDLQSDFDVNSDGEYIQNELERMLSKGFLMEAHGKVDLSGGLAASGGGIHHVMTGRRGL